MPTKPIPGGSLAVQRAVLALVLAVQPHCRTVPELDREIDLGDAVEQAVQDLVGIGLLERRGASVRPSPAAAHFYRLDLP